MIDEFLAHAAAGAWALPVLFAVVLADAFLVVVPGEAAVSAMGALAVTTGAPPLIAVILVGAVAAFAGDACCYLLGRTVGLTRWRWMRHPRVARAFDGARSRLDRSTAVVVFTARFIPFARLAVNLVAGASHVPAVRYLGVVGVAALGWGSYQAVVGAAVGILVPGGPLVAVVVSIVVAIGLGVTIDAVVARVSRRRTPTAAASDRSREDDPMTAVLGYDPAFLGLDAPLPTPRSAAAVSELVYPRFTVVLDTARRFAAVTAVNIDGERLLDLPRAGEWAFDPRVPESAQAGDEVYRGNDLDRGHLVRRRDPGWGTPDEARAAMRATFFYTNAAPQAAGFNQSKELWLGLEDHVLAYAETTAQRLSVFTAPVLDPADPPYRGILVPRRFWKIAAWRATDAEGAAALAAAGFVLDQSDLVAAAAVAGGIEPLGGFRTFQVPIGEIAELAGVGLGPLVGADALARRGARGGSAWRALDSVDDILL